MVVEILKLLRVKHYVKNILIVAPLAFSGQMLMDIVRGETVLLAVLSFSFISSSIYIVNDVVDRERDAKHPKKCNRPLASGIVSVPLALAVSSGLAVLAILTAFYVSMISSWIVILILLGYFFLNLAYSLSLKNIPVIEVAILASGFLLRVLYGGYATGIEVSEWLYLTVLSVSFYMGLGKRRNEFYKLESSETRSVLQHYNRRFLDRNMYMFLALTICFYSLWAMEQGKWALISVPLIMILCMRYSLIIEGSSDGDPVDVIFADKSLLVLGALYVLYMFSSLYIL